MSIAHSISVQNLSLLIILVYDLYISLNLDNVCIIYLSWASHRQTLGLAPVREEPGLRIDLRVSSETKDAFLLTLL